MELIVFKSSVVGQNGGGRGGINVLRLVCKRLMQVVESCATRLTNQQYNGPESLPLALRRCMRIEHIRSYSRNLRSLEGCPNGLKSLYIDGSSLQSLEPLNGCTELESLVISNPCRISDLSPLASCTRIKKLTIILSQVTDISALSSMPLLEEVDLGKNVHYPSIKDLSPLIQCKRLRVLDIGGNQDIEDISPLTQCSQLEELLMWGLTKITDLKPLSSLIKLKKLGIGNVPVEDLTPLSALQGLEELRCYYIPLTTSLLPLERCSKLRTLYCYSSAKDYAMLRERRPDIES